MSLAPARFTVRRLMLAVACLAPILAYVAAPVYRLSRYARVQRQMYDMISALQLPVPQGTNPSHWECASSWTVTAYANVCFSEEHVTVEEMHRLRDDLQAKLQEVPSKDMLVWIWDRLARTGPHGREYVARFKPWFMNCFPLS